MPAINLLEGVASEATLEQVLAALPEDPATQATLAAVLAKITSDPASQTTLAAVLAKISNDPASQTTLAAILAKLPSAPATQATLVDILNELKGTIDVAGPLTEAQLISAALATAANQVALKASIDALLAAIRPATGHFLVVPSAAALANPTRSIVCATGGTLTCTVAGVSLSYTVFPGQQLNVVATVISAAPAGTIGQF